MMRLKSLTVKPMTINSRQKERANNVISAILNEIDADNRRVLHQLLDFTRSSRTNSYASF